MHRFFVPPESITQNQVTLPDGVARQLSQVLRMNPGDEIIVLDNSGAEYRVRLDRLDRKGAAGTILERQIAPGEASIHVALFMSLLKKDNFEWVLQKCAEIGVSEFVPVITQRTVVNADVSSNKRERWQRILTEAAEQSGRGKVPTLRDPLDFEAALERIAGYDRALIPWEGETAALLRDHLPIPAGQRVAIFIGPEGGYDANEIERAAARNVIPVSLGRRILRAETAAVAACALIHHYAE